MDNSMLDTLATSGDMTEICEQRNLGNNKKEPL